MALKQNSFIALSAIFSVTLIGVIALSRDTDTKLDFNFGKALGSLTIEVKRPQTKTNDCLPGGESSHRLNCDNQ